jgi:hypothetical protein
MLPTPTVEGFADAAREFIAWVESEPGEPNDEARTAQRHLARASEIPPPALTLPFSRVLVAGGG